MSKKSRVVIIVQARMGSTRLPGKVMKEVLGKPLLQYQIERLKRVQLADEIVIATTYLAKDKVITDFCQRYGVASYKGDEEDVLKRYMEAAREFDADIIVRITSDCPLIDPLIIDEGIRCFLDQPEPLDYLSNSLIRTFPRGMEVEVFSRPALEHAFKEVVLEEEKEHVTLHFYRNPEKFRMGRFVRSKDQSGYRLTVDTIEDFELIRKILEALYPVNSQFTLEDIIALFQNHPEWCEINRHIKQKEV